MKLPGFALALSIALAAAASYAPPIGPIKRLSDQPVLGPRGDGFEAAGTFNPTVIREKDHYTMLYRAQDRSGLSYIGHAVSKDGVHFKRSAHPVLTPEADYEKGGGVEDPRVVHIGNRYLLTYTGYNKKDAQLCLATSHNLLHWVRRGVLLPAYKGKWNVGWTKSGAILDQKVSGKYWMYFMGDAKGKPGQMGIASSPDALKWSEVLAQPVMSTRPGMFDSRVVEPGPPPFLTPKGIMLIYNGADDRLVYRTGWVLFDREDPAKIVARAEAPIFEVNQNWEQRGQVPNVVFVAGLVREPSRWLFYYGGADKYVGVAAAPVL